jgi:pimeloyl-ACP methyl ester carboxylesterase
MIDPRIRKAYVDTSVGQLHYRSVDAPGSAFAPVLFFHRTPVTSASFTRVLQQLAGWRRLIAFDTPGFGESFVPADDAGMATFVRAFTDAIAALGIERFHLVGHHTGCHFAAELAALSGSGALSLLLDGAMVPSAEERARVVPPIPAPVIDRSGSYARNAWDFLQPFYTVFDERCIHDEYVGALASTFTRTACMKVVRGHDLAALLAAIRCPIVACAAQDDVFAPHLERVSAVNSAAVIRRYGNAGIASPELQTAAFCGLVQEAVALGERGTAG